MALLFPVTFCGLLSAQGRQTENYWVRLGNVIRHLKFHQETKWKPIPTTVRNAWEVQRQTFYNAVNKFHLKCSTFRLKSRNYFGTQAQKSVFATNKPSSLESHHPTPPPPSPDPSVIMIYAIDRHTSKKHVNKYFLEKYFWARGDAECMQPAPLQRISIVLLHERNRPEAS